MNDHDFRRIRLDSFEPSACSPSFDDEARGLRVAAPRAVRLGPDAAFPLCGTYRVGGRFLNRFESMANELVVVAVDARAHRPYATNLLTPGSTPMPSGLDESAPGFEAAVLTGWFNLDLFRWMEDLPRQPGRYHVFATVGELASNVVTVELAAP